MTYQNWMVALAMPVMLIGCVSSGGEADPDRGPIGKADLVGTCEHDDGGDHCGGSSGLNCWCDDLCESFGDCCEDKQEVCDGDSCPPVLCTLFCENGFKTDEDGCETCECNDDGCGFFGCSPCQDAGFVCEDAFANSGQCPAGMTAEPHSCNPDEFTIIEAVCCSPTPVPPVCPDPDDPNVDYISQDVLECAAILFECLEGHTGFSNDCGCGCIDERDPAEGFCVKNSNDECSSDDDCISGGCGGELCFNPDVGNGLSTCECTAPGPDAATGCGCVAGKCTWWN